MSFNAEFPGNGSDLDRITAREPVSDFCLGRNLEMLNHPGPGISRADRVLCHGSLNECD